MSGYLVLDASVAVKLVAEETDSALAERLRRDALASQTRFVAPPHFSVEVTNVLRKKVWLEGLSTFDAERALERFLAMDFIRTEPPRLYQRAFSLATQYDRRAVYDSHYVALAEILGCDLWTADQNLVNVMQKDLPFIHLLKDYH